ncbi:MAG TPA: hypothetical protein VKA84_27265 [Gemmatimonadaceae bacterium]|nr:hypothetical protein [Gemmatimonadaceae bacterium]
MLWRHTSTLALLLTLAPARPAAAQGVTHADTLRSLEAGGGTTCVTTTAGAAYCWGAIGDGRGTIHRVVGLDGRPVRAQSVAAWGGSICALTHDGEAWCEPSITGGWIDSAGADLTLAAPCVRGACVTRLPMRGALPAQPLRTVAAGPLHACALAANGAAFCWGRNHMGQLGNGSWAPDSTGSAGEIVRAPVAVTGGLRFAQLSAGEDLTCGLTQVGGRVWCWGYAQSGQTGDSATATYCAGDLPYANRTCSRATPALVRPESLPGDRAPGDVRFVRVHAGMRLACAAAADGAAYCWGNNYRCALGRCGVPDSPRAHRVQLPGRAVDVRAGYYHACARTADARVFCWGDNTEGQLGSLVSVNAGADGLPPNYRDTTDNGAQSSAYGDPCFLGGRCSPVPVEVSQGRRWAALAVGTSHACALAEDDGGVYCWGGTDSAALGRGARFVLCQNRSPQWKDVRCQPTPTRVVGLPRLAAPRASSAIAGAPELRGRVLASAREVRIIFPRDTARAWGWSERDDPSVSAGYVWHVVVDGLDGPESISLQAGRGYGGGARDFPSLDSLVAAGWTLHCAAGAGMSGDCARDVVAARVEAGRVVLTMRDSATIRRLFGMRPPFVRLWHARPDAESRGDVDSVRVEYVAPQLPAPDAAMRAEAAPRRRRYEARVNEITRHISAGRADLAGGVVSELWLAVGDTALLYVSEAHCSFDACGVHPSASVLDSGWSVTDSTVVALRNPPEPPRLGRSGTGSSAPAPVAAAVALRPGRTELRVRGLHSPADTMPSRTPVPRELRRRVVVTPPVGRVRIAPLPDSVYVGDTVDVRVRVTDRAGRPIEGAPAGLLVTGGSMNRFWTAAGPVRFVPTAPGRLRLIASFASFADTLTLDVRQRRTAPASPP